MFFKNLRLRPKLLTVGLVLTFLPLIVFSVITYYQNAKAMEVSRQESIRCCNALSEPIWPIPSKN